MRPSRRLLMIAAGTAVALGAAGFVAVGRGTVERRVEALLADHVRAPCTFTEARFVPFSGMVVHGLEILDPEDPLGEPALRIEEVRIDTSVNLLGSGVALERILLVRPHVRITRRADGSLSLEDLISLPPAPDGEPPRTPPVEIVSGRVVVTDRGLFREGVALELTEVNGRLEAIGPDVPAAVRLRGRSAETGDLEFEATLLPGGGGSAVLKLAEVRLDGDLARGLDGEVGEIVRRDAAEGAARVRAETTWTPAGKPSIDLTVEPLGAAFSVFPPTAPENTPEPTPLRVEGLTGSLHWSDSDRLVLDGIAFGALGGRFTVSGTVDGLADEDPRGELRATAADLSVTSALHDHMPWSARRVVEAFGLSGLVQATFTLKGRFDDPETVLTAELTGGTFSYVGYREPGGEPEGGFPYAVTDVSGSMSLAGPLLRFEGTAARGGTRIRGGGHILSQPDHPDGTRVTDEMEIVIHGDDVLLDRALRDGFREGAPRKFDRWGPGGIAEHVEVRVLSTPGLDTRGGVTEVIVDLDGRATFRPYLFPTDLHGTAGQVEILRPVEDGRRQDTVRLTGVKVAGDGFTLAVDGEVREGDLRPGEDLTVVAEVEDLAGAFGTAVLASERIPEEIRDHYRAIAPSGGARIVALLATDGEARSSGAEVELRGVSTPGWSQMPLPVTDLTGTVTVRDGVVLREVAGRLLGAPVAAEGTVGGEPDLSLDVKAVQLPLGRRLRDAMGPLAEHAAPFWDELRPSGDARGDAVVTLRPGMGPNAPTEATVLLSGLRGRYFPLGLDVVVADGRIAYDGRTATLRLVGSMGGAGLDLRHLTVDVETGGLTANVGLRALQFPEDLAGLLDPEEIDAIAGVVPDRLLHAPDLEVAWDPQSRKLDLTGWVEFRPRSRDRAPTGLAPMGRLGLLPLGLRMREDGITEVSGELVPEEFRMDPGVPIRDLGAVALIQGTLGGGPARVNVDLADGAFSVWDRKVRQAVARVSVEGSRVAVRDFRGRLAGGEVTAEVETWEGRGGFSRSRAEVALRGARADLFFSGTEDEDLVGRIDGAARFTGGGPDDNPMGGPGWLTLSDGRVGRVPVVARIFGVLGEILSHVPLVGGGEDFGAFRSGRMDFELQGRSLQVKDLTVESPGVALERGRGRIDLDGRLDLVVAYRQSLLAPLDIVFGPLQKLVGLDLRITGPVTDPQVRAEPKLGPLRTGGDGEPEPLPVEPDPAEPAYPF